MPVFRALLPQDFSISGGDWSGPTFSAAAQAAPIRVLGQRLSDTHELDSILQSIAKTHGMWRNVCALGIFDPAVWHTLDIVWGILLTALSFSTNQPELMACS
ncbi:hypothetical protein ONZ45_g17474 [Pleurotus djamor]|nr:hypothetical protein ONZ45_g17474 [Pleurotus djamor]